MKNINQTQSNNIASYIAVGMLTLVIGYLVGTLYPLPIVKDNNTAKTITNNSNQDVAAKQKVVNKNDDENFPFENTNVVQQDEASNQEISEGELSTTQAVEGIQKNFNITFPDSWTLETTKDDLSSVTTLTKNKQRIIISQGSTGSSRCMYTDEADYKIQPEYPHIKYYGYSEQNTHDLTLRRGGWQSTLTDYDVCSKPVGENQYNLYTSVGFIHYEVSKNHTEDDLKEMDEIIASIFK